jgi:hypothetical protein
LALTIISSILSAITGAAKSDAVKINRTEKSRNDRLIMVFLRHNYMDQVLRVSLRISGLSATPYLAVIIV